MNRRLRLIDTLWRIAFAVSALAIAVWWTIPNISAPTKNPLAIRPLPPWTPLPVQPRPRPTTAEILQRDESRSNLASLTSQFADYMSENLFDIHILASQYRVPNDSFIFKFDWHRRGTDEMGTEMMFLIRSEDGKAYVAESTNSSESVALAECIHRFRGSLSQNK